MLFFSTEKQQLESITMRLLLLLFIFTLSQCEVPQCLYVLEEALEGELSVDGMPHLSEQPTSCEPEQGVSDRMIEIGSMANAMLLSVRRRWIAAFNSALIECPDDDVTKKQLSRIKKKLKEKVLYTGSEIRRGVIRPLDLIQRETYRDKGLSTDNQCITWWPNIANIVKVCIFQLFNSRFLIKMSCFLTLTKHNHQTGKMGEISN